MTCDREEKKYFEDLKAFIFSFKPLECQDALGMESRAITDAQITASSEHNAVHAASHARLNFQEIPNQAAGAWVAIANDDNQWLQVDLGAHYTKVTRIATQGRNSLNFSQWVTEYKLQYRDKEEEFQFYREPGQDMDEGKILHVHILNFFFSCYSYPFRNK